MFYYLAQFRFDHFTGYKKKQIVTIKMLLPVFDSTLRMCSVTIDTEHVRKVLSNMVFLKYGTVRPVFKKIEICQLQLTL